VQRQSGSPALLWDVTSKRASEDRGNPEANYDWAFFEKPVMSNCNLDRSLTLTLASCVSLFR
jgi:hypothetical protein